MSERHDIVELVERTEVPVALFDDAGAVSATSPGLLRLLREGEVVDAALERLLGGSPGALVRTVAEGRIAMRERASWRVIGLPCGGHVALVLVEDVHARLTERETFIRSLFDASPVGLNLCRMDGLWLQSNRAFLDIIGYRAAEADGGLTYWQLTPREYDDQERLQLASLTRDGRYGPYEKEFVRKDGTRVPVRLNGFVVERDGERFIWSMIEDISRERALAAKLEEEREKAIHAGKLASLGEIAAGLAHEVNNPLAIIEALAFELEHAIANGETEDLGELVAGIREATQRAASVVRGLRMFSRRGDTNVVEGAIGALVQDALVLVRPRVKYEGVDLTIEVSTDAVVRVSPVELGQVIVNLVNNAIDAVRESDQRWVRVRVDDADDATRITVEDPGAGVPKEDEEKLFSPFFTTKQAAEGTGLGLSISKGIVERCGGSLRYEREGGRTRFVVLLPRVTGAEEGSS